MRAPLTWLARSRMPLTKPGIDRGVPTTPWRAGEDACAYPGTHAPCVVRQRPATRTPLPSLNPAVPRERGSGQLDRPEHAMQVQVDIVKIVKEFLQELLSTLFAVDRIRVVGA